MICHRRIALIVVSVAVVACAIGAPVAPAGADRGVSVGDRDGVVRVERDGPASGGAALMHRRDGLPIDRPNGHADLKGTARGYMVEHGPVFGLAGSASSIGTLRITRTATGHVVHGTQHIYGLPVYGSDVVASLDADQNLLSISAETARPPAHVDFRTPSPVARGIAAAAVAAGHQLAPRVLQTSEGRRWLYDPTLVGEAPVPAGARPVWRFTVTGPGIHETGLVDATRGGMALRVSEIWCAPGSAGLVFLDSGV